MTAFDRHLGPARLEKLDFGKVPSTPYPLVSVAPSPACELCVVIPVYNEEAGIEQTLSALAAQVDLDGQSFDSERFEILVFANNCDDDTGRIVLDFGRSRPDLNLHLIEAILAPPHANVGTARRVVMDEACRRLGRIGRPRGVIASTDGDTQVDRSWVAATLREVARGADAVGGRIQASREELAALDPCIRRFYNRDLAYRTLRAAYESILLPDPFNPWPRHHHCFGGSLAVTAEAYLRAGGLPPVQCLEDLAFARALTRTGARVRHSPEVSVRTSMRQQGRVPAGLSCTLAIWARAAADGAPWLVEPADAVESAAKTWELTQILWQATRPGSVRAQAARQLGMEADWLHQTRQRCHSAGEFHLQVADRQQAEGIGPFAFQKVEVRQASAELRARLAPHRTALRGAARLQQQRDSEEWLPEEQNEDELAA